MTWMPIEWERAHIPEPANPSASTIPVGLRVTGSVLRLVFLTCLLAITVLVALPQNESIWTVYDTPGDVVRLALGFAVCIWVALQLFWAPNDAESYRTWVYFGLAAVPFSIICLVATWIW
jgi:hypothetical protein